MTDEEAVRGFLAAWDESWAPSDRYVAAVVARMAELRVEHPTGEYPARTHGIEEIGACVECDALSSLLALEDAEEGHV